MIKANRNLNKLTPQFKQKVELFLKEATNIFITEGWRSQARQQDLYNQGRTTPGKIITWTLKSNHMKGEAIDIAFIGNELYPKNKGIWIKIFNIAKRYGIDSGFVMWGVDLPHLQDNGKPLVISNYNGLKVVIGGNKKMEKLYNAYYDPKTDILHIMPLYFKIEDEMIRESVLIHEHSHYVFIKKIPKWYQKLWKGVWMFDEKLVKKINSIFKTNYKKNEFVTNYASTNYLEGFAENIEEEYKRIKLGKSKYKGFLGIKILICNILYNKYKGGV